MNISYLIFIFILVVCIGLGVEYFLTCRRIKRLHTPVQNVENKQENIEKKQEYDEEYVKKCLEIRRRLDYEESLNRKNNDDFKISKVKIDNAWDKDRWLNSLELLWDGRIEINFAYTDKNGIRERRNVRLERVLRDNSNKKIYLYGFCRLRNDYRSFNIARISSKIKEVTVKEYFYEDEFLYLLGIGKKRNLLHTGYVEAYNQRIKPVRMKLIRALKKRLRKLS